MSTFDTLPVRWERSLGAVPTQAATVWRRTIRFSASQTICSPLFSHSVPFSSPMHVQVFLAVFTFLLTFFSEGYALRPSLEAESGITAKVSTPPPARSPYRRERSSLLGSSSRDSATLSYDEKGLV